MTVFGRILILFFLAILLASCATLAPQPNAKPEAVLVSSNEEVADGTIVCREVGLGDVRDLQLLSNGGNGYPYTGIVLNDFTVIVVSGWTSFKPGWYIYKPGNDLGQYVKDRSSCPINAAIFSEK